MERLTTEYLFIFVSAGSSFILYLLVFFRLRGNITLSAGYKIHFHQRPQMRISSTIDGVSIMTDDRHVDSHVMVVARHMLRHPIAYIILVLPLAATRLSAFSGTSAPFPITAFSASIFVLTGFINAVLFCTTRNIIPGGWRQRLSIRATLSGKRSDACSPHWRDPTRRFTESASRKEAVETGRSPVSLGISVEKDVEIDHVETPPSSSFGSPISPTWPLRADGGSHHTRRLSFSPPLDERMSVRIGAHGVGQNGDLNEEVYPVVNTNTVAGIVRQHPVRTSGTAMPQPVPGLEAPASVYPLVTAPPISINTRRLRSSSIGTLETAINHTHLA
jgi:hypothetical protein